MSAKLLRNYYLQYRHYQKLEKEDLAAITINLKNKMKSSNKLIKEQKARNAKFEKLESDVVIKKMQTLYYSIKKCRPYIIRPIS